MVPTTGQASPAATTEAADVPAPRSVEHSWMSLKEWRERHEAQLAAPGRAQAELALVGDSITQMWADTEAYRELSPYRPLNLGIGGDQTQHVLWRLEHGSLTGTAPRVILVLIGVNNLGNGYRPEQTVRGVLAVVRSLRDKVPGAKIVLLGILPTGALPTDPMRHKVIETNRLLQSAELPEGVSYHDIGAHFVEPDGRILPSTMADGLHPTPSGFALLAREVRPLIERALCAE
jgi:lysophospholipase L1-like esterase